jgi:hypothetical protein
VGSDVQGPAWGRAKAASEGLAPAWLGPGRGFWQRGHIIVVVVCGRGEGVVVVVVAIVICLYLNNH